MKSKLLLLGMIALLIAAGVAAIAEMVPAEVSVTKTDGDVVIASDETVKDVTATNGSVIVYGHVTGNVKAVNGHVRVRSGGVIDGEAQAVNGKVVKEKGGSIRGDRYSGEGNAAGSRGSSKTDVHGDVVVQKGQTVKEVSTVQGDVTVYGHVTRDATAVMGNVDVRPGGRIDGDATSVMGDLHVRENGTIAGDATSVMGDIRVRKGGKIGGDATAVMGVIHEFGGTIDGSTTNLGFTLPKWLFGGIGEWKGLTILAILWVAIVLLQIAVAALVVALFPGRMQIIADCFISQPGWSLLYGLIGLIAAIPVALLLLVSCVGIPFIGLEAALLFVIWIAGSVGVKLAVGQKVRRFRSPVWAAVVGAILLGLVTLVPFVGELIVHILVVMGVGAVIMTGFGAAPDWFSRRMSKTPPPPPAPGPTEGASNPGDDVAPGASATP